MDDLKVFPAGEAKLKRVLRATKATMEDDGLEWNENKYNLAQENATGFKADQVKVDCLDDGAQFLGAPERLLQNQKLTLSSAA